MLLGATHLIKADQPIDYYVIYYPRMVAAYFQCLNGRGDPLGPLADTIEEHIQAVVEENNKTIYLTRRATDRITRHGIALKYKSPNSTKSIT